MEDREIPKSIPSLNEIKAMAANEDWDGVDTVIGSAANDPSFLVWAEGGLEDEDGNLRDLAASLFEKTDTPLSPGVTETLLSHVRHDDNPYASFRSAFALYRAGNRSPEVIKKLHEALEDEDVADIAKEYLSSK